MKVKSVGLIILWWVETVVAIRVLLFTVPVMISKYTSANFEMTGVSDRFVFVMTAAALMFLVVGAASIAGYRYWKAIHLLAAFFTILVTVGSLTLLGQPTGQVGVFYYTPIIMAVIFVAFASLLGNPARSS